MLVGYVPNGYKVYNIQNKRFIITRDVIFDETNFTTSRKELDETIEIDRYLVENTNDSVSINNEELSAIDCADDKFVNNLHPGKTDKIINKCNQTPNIRGVTDKCIKQKQNTLELSGQG